MKKFKNGYGDWELFYTYRDQDGDEITVKYDTYNSPLDIFFARLHISEKYKKQGIEVDFHYKEKVK